MTTISAAVPALWVAARVRRLRIAVAAAAAWVAAYAGATAVLAHDTRAEHWLSDGVYLVPVALASVLSLRAARRTTGRRRVFWAVLTCSNLLWLAGEVAWSTYVLVLGRSAPFPSIADLFYVSSYALVPVAVLGGFALRPGARTIRSLLDASAVVAAVGLLGWSLLIGPQLAWGMSLATATGIAYPLLGVAILMLLVSVGVVGVRHVPLSILLVGAAFAVSALTDAAYTYFAVLHSSIDSTWLNIGWQAEAALICVGALVAASREAEPEPRPRRDRGLLLVLGGGLAAVVVLTLDARDGVISTPSLVLGAYAAGAVMLRLYITWRENDRLAHRLETSLSEEERLVAQLQEQNKQLTKQTQLLHESLNLRERAERERAALEDQLRHSQKIEAVAQLAAGIAQGFTDLLGAMARSSAELEQSLQGDERRRAAEIHAAAGQASSLMNELLSFGRTQILEPVVLELKDVVHGTEELLPLLGEAIEVSVDDGTESCLVEVDPAQLQQVIFNLAVNARDAMPDGGRLTIAVGKADLFSDMSRAKLDLPRGRYACLTIEDTGCGMDPDAQRHAFEPFFTTKSTGTGLGLATAHGLIRQSGGDMRFESRAGAGTRFELFLPLAAA
jgi:signal transduction histidine kinase